MRAAIFNGPHSITVGDRPDPAIQEPTDAIVRVVLGCVCGSDLWYYRGESPHAVGSIGHEFIGVVEDIGSEVDGVAKGDFVVAPFVYCDMSCPHCRAGVTSHCIAGGSFGNGEIDGGQGEAVRVPLAGSTLVPVPGSSSGHSDQTLRSLLALSDVMRTGHHAAVCGRVAKGDTATDILAERGEDDITAVLELTNGIGVDAALECVGTAESMATALAIARPGSTVGVVGAPHGADVPFEANFWRGVGWQGGVAPARAYIPELLDDVLSGAIDPGRVFDYETSLGGIADAYAAMDERRAIKSLVRVGSI